MSTVQIAAVFAVLADAALRGTVILGAALAATRLMKRRSAAARHLVWVVALASMLCLPLVTRSLPAWRVVPVPAPLRPATEFVAAPVASSVAPAGEVDAPASAPSVSSAPSTAAPSTAAPSVLAPAHTAASTPALASSFDWKLALAVLWGVGGVLVALRLVVGIGRVWWMRHRAVEITDDEWVRITDGLARRLRVGRMVTLLREAHAVVPMTWGIVRPVVLLPAGAEEWDAERRTVVLAHELAHVRRRDTLTQWVAHLAVALFWFHPLVWVAARRMREEREHACDDAVLSIGTRPVEYADHLLSIVRSLGSAEGPAAALAMARRSQFEGRLLAILDGATPRGGVSRGVGLAALAVAAAAVLPLAALRAALPRNEAVVPASAVTALVPKAIDQKPEGKGLLAQVTGHVRALMDQALADSARQAQTAAAPALSQTPQSSGAALSAAPASPASAGSASSAATPLGTAAKPAAPAAAAGEAPSDTRVKEMLQQGDYADVIRAAATIASSTDRATVLMAVLKRPDVEADDLTTLLRVAATISSEPARRDVLKMAVERYPLTSAPVRRAFFGAVSAFASCPERRDVLFAALPRWAEPEVASAILSSTREMTSEPERRDVLLRLADRPLSAEVLIAYARASAELTGSPVRRDVLQKLLARPSLPPAVLREALSAAAGIVSSPDKRDVLVFAARHQRIDGAAREAYLTAAGTIVSSPERVDAVTALLGPGATQAAGPKPGTTTTISSSHVHEDDGDGESTWNSDVVLTLGDGRKVHIFSKNVTRGARADDIRSIGRGGRVMVEEIRDGVTRHAEMRPGTGGTIDRTYTVNGRSHPYDAEAQRWVSAVLREFTQA